MLWILVTCSFSTGTWPSVRADIRAENGMLEVNHEGTKYGMLNAKGEIMWSDGDVDRCADLCHVLQIWGENRTR